MEVGAVMEEGVAALSEIGCVRISWGFETCFSARFFPPAKASIAAKDLARGTSGVRFLVSIGLFMGFYGLTA